MPDSVPAKPCQTMRNEESEELINEYSLLHPDAQPLKPGFFLVEPLSYFQPESFATTMVKRDMYVKLNRTALQEQLTRRAVDSVVEKIVIGTFREEKLAPVRPPASIPESRRSRRRRDSFGECDVIWTPILRTRPLQGISENSSRRNGDAPSESNPSGAGIRHDERLHRPFNMHGEYIDGPYSNPPVPNGNPLNENANPPVPNGDPLNGDANPPALNPVPAPPIKRPRGRPRKNPIANVPHAEPVIQQPAEFEASLQRPSAIIPCLSCNVRMRASTIPKHKCAPIKCGLLPLLPESSVKLQSPSVALESERHSTGDNRQGSEDEADADGDEASDPASELLNQQAGQDGEDGEVGEVDEDDRENRMWPLQGAKRVRLDEADDVNNVYDEDIDNLGPLGRMDWMHCNPDVSEFRPNDARLITGSMSTHDRVDGDNDEMDWGSWALV